MTVEKTNPISGHQLVIMPATSQQKDLFGWIRLVNGVNDVGYIYLQEALIPTDPHLSSDGSYIVTTMPMSSLQTLLYILHNEKNLEIRYYDPQSAGVAPSAFIEQATPSALGGARLPALVAVSKEIDRLLMAK